MSETEERERISDWKIYEPGRQTELGNVRMYLMAVAISLAKLPLEGIHSPKMLKAPSASKCPRSNVGRIRTLGSIKGYPSFGLSTHILKRFLRQTISP